MLCYGFLHRFSFFSVLIYFFLLNLCWLIAKRNAYRRCNYVDEWVVIVTSVKCEKIFILIKVTYSFWLCKNVFYQRLIRIINGDGVIENCPKRSPFNRGKQKMKRKCHAQWKACADSRGFQVEINNALPSKSVWMGRAKRPGRDLGVRFPFPWYGRKHEEARRRHTLFWRNTATVEKPWR